VYSSLIDTTEFGPSRRGLERQIAVTCHFDRDLLVARGVRELPVKLVVNGAARGPKQVKGAPNPLQITKQRQF
jgi:hypothetical protein